MSQPGLFDEPRTAPATAPTQVRAERIQSVVGQDAGQRPVSPVATKKPEKFTALAKGDPVTLGGREYAFHRACGEHVWLAALDAGIAGPFYRHRTQELTVLVGRKGEITVPVDPKTVSAGKPASHNDSREKRIEAAQARLAACETNGPEYMAALAELCAGMRGGA